MSFIIHLHREKKNYGKKDLAGFEPVSLGCEDEHLNHLARAKPRKYLLMSWQAAEIFDSGLNITVSHWSFADQKLLMANHFY